MRVIAIGCSPTSPRGAPRWTKPRARTRPSLVQILSYLAAVDDQLQPEEFRAKILEHAPAAGEVTMSWTEQWFREGREAGRQEGRQEGRQGALRQLLRAKFGALAPELEARIAAATPAELDRYLERVLVADTAAAVFAP